MKTFGIIGSGMIAKYHAKAISEISRAKLGGIYSRNADTGKKICSEFQTTYYSHIDEFLSNEEIEIITIATPSGVHLDAITDAANHGKHIICEKPLEITSKRIEDAKKIADKNNVLLGGIFNRRFNPAVDAIKKALDLDRFGTISICSAQILWHRSQEYYDSAAWRGTWALDGGGALMNQGIHTIDLLIYFMGMPVKVCGSISTMTHNRIEVEDTAAAILEFENGAKGVIQGSTSSWSTLGRPAKVQIIGDEGSVTVADDFLVDWDFKEHQKSDETVKKELMGSHTAEGANDPSSISYLGHQKNFENFIAALDQSEPLKVTVDEAVKSVKIIEAIYESSQTGGGWIEV